MICFDFVLQFSAAWTQTRESDSETYPRLTWQEEKWRYMDMQDRRYFKLDNIFILFKLEDTVSKFFHLHVSYATQF